MTLDPGARRTVACAVALAGLAGLAGCPPAVRPEAPGEAPEETPPSRVSPRPAPQSGHGALIGEMCPQGAAGRPGLAPLAVRDVSWSSVPEDMVTPLARGTAAQFTVLAVDGRRAGVFSSIGTAEGGGTALVIAFGSFVGSPPCSRPGKGTDVTGDAVCLSAQKGCGLAVAKLGPPGGAFGEGEAPDVVTGGVCKSGDVLAIDVDADGAPEMFPVGGFVDATRAPSAEVSAAAVVAPTCTPVFAMHGLVPPAVPGVAMDGKHKIELDVLGVVDVDGDGRRELIVAFRYLEGRTIAVYSAMSTAARLELVGETVPWPNP